MWNARNLAVGSSFDVQQMGSDGRVHKKPALIKSCFDAMCVHWKDTDGNRIEAHGGGMLQVRPQYSDIRSTTPLSI